MGKTPSPVSSVNVVYHRRRWYILAVIALVNFSNNMAWLTYAPISSFAADYYGRAAAPTLLNVIFMACAPVGLLSMWANAKYGLRFGCLLGAWMNFVGVLLRFIASTETFNVATAGNDDAAAAVWRFYVTLAGQTLAAGAQPFVMYLPTQLAAVWFPPAQRVVASTLASLSNPLGAATVFAFAPHFVNAERPRAFLQLNGIITGCAFFSALISLGVTSSRPPFDLRPVATPPPESVSKAEAEVGTPQSLWRGIRLALASRSFVVLALSLGSGFGLFSALCNFLQPVLCSKGYSNAFAGALGAGMIVAGLAVSTLVGVFVGRTRLYEETMKVCFCGAALAACVLMVAARFGDVAPVVAGAVLAFGAFGLTIYPLGLELGVETTFPLPESTSTGLLSLTGQIFGFVYVSLTSLLKQPADVEQLAAQTCTANETPLGVYNWKYATILWASCVVGTAVMFAFIFWPKYYRIEYEMAVAQSRRRSMPSRPPLMQLPSQASVDEPLNPNGNDGGSDVV